MPSTSKHAMRPLAAAALAALVIGCGDPRPLSPRNQENEAAKSPQDVIRQFEAAYGARAYARFEALLSNEPGAEYLFYPDPTWPEAPYWDRVEELRIHKRMFEPQSIPPGDPPLDTEMWLSSIDITLTPVAAFVEGRGDLYYPENPDGLHRDRWKAWEATYRTHVLFDTQGQLDYVISGRADFVVIEDLAKRAGESGKFLLYRWKDRYGSGAYRASEPSSWTSVKRLYR